MTVRILELRLPISHDPGAVRKKAAKMLRVDPEDVRDLSVIRRSVDARKKPELTFCYTVDVTLSDKAQKRFRPSSGIKIYTEKEYRFPESGDKVLAQRPVIIGTGPAGLFCGLKLAQAGYRPLIFERGEDMDKRRAAVKTFWEGGKLDPESNVQFGEGGAGTFSDGKLNTLIHDPDGRNREVLKTFAAFGADESILYESRPHIGTDMLCGIVKNMRRCICELGGDVFFGKCLSDIVTQDGHVSGLIIRDTHTEESSVIKAQVLVLATGHSARDTFEMLNLKGIPMEAKAFAVGLRVEHPQSMINISQYGREEVNEVGPASYKLTAKSSRGRGVYSFCMCPGGYVVNASSEPERLAVNGMSYFGRDGVNANSAIVVTVGPDDLSDGSLFSGMNFQRELEERAYKAGNGRVPIQLYADFREGVKSPSLGDVKPQIKGEWELSDLRGILPEELNQALIEGMDNFGKKIEGFDRPDALFAGVESRTSSPLRILRGKDRQSALIGLYPCGEGAGYAGGITSAAVDGIKTAEEIARLYAPLG